MKSKRTKQLRNKKWATRLLNWLLCFGTFIAYLIIFIATRNTTTSFSDKLGTVLTGFLVSVIPFLAIVILVKNKVRPLIWMGNVILAQYLFGEAALYLTFAIWVVDEYIVAPLSKKFALDHEINREIDKR